MIPYEIKTEGMQYLYVQYCELFAPFPNYFDLGKLITP